MAFTRTHCCNRSHFLFEAVRRMRHDALRFLLLEGGGADVDEHCGGQRPVHLAVQRCLMKGDLGHRMAALLLESGARPNRCPGDSEKLDPPLHDAARRGSAAAVELLLASGASPDDVDADGRTPLHALCMNAVPAPVSDCGERVLDLLLAHGACPVRADAHGFAPVAYLHDLKLGKRVTSAGQWWSRRALTFARNWDAGQSDEHCAEKQAADPFQDVLAATLDVIVSFV